MFSHSRTEKAENSLISIHACNVFTDWKLKQELSSQITVLYLMCNKTKLSTVQEVNFFRDTKWGGGGGGGGGGRGHVEMS